MDRTTAETLRRDVVALTTAWRDSAELHHELAVTIDLERFAGVSLLLAQAPVELLATVTDDATTIDHWWAAATERAQQRTFDAGTRIAEVLPAAFTAAELLAAGRRHEAHEILSAVLAAGSHTHDLLAAQSAVVAATVEEYCSQTGTDPDGFLQRWGSSVA